MDRQRVIEKVIKCFALARSQGATPNEAETALRQARSLMKQFNLEALEIDACLASESSIPTGTRRQPADWLHSLAGTCARAFDCDYLAYHALTAGWSFKFVGLGISPELASYAYSALHQQLLTARRLHVAEQKRCKLSTKRRRGQIFAEAWISAVSATVRKFASDTPPEAKQTISAFLTLHHPNLEHSENQVIAAKGHDVRSMYAGWEQGATASIHRGVGHSGRTTLAIGGGR